ncbi:RNA polymerase sigma factor [Streptomyces lavendulocolor]|uniref:RNA polymerase sigma factor n=1 Tax=Streptomyces lavendulocolor TaxID=67316 RepID=UPI0033C92BDE
MHVERDISPAKADDLMSSAYKDLHAEIFRYIHSKSGDWSLAEDLTSETFLKALRYEGSTVRNLTPWLYTIARNLLYDYFRSAAFRCEILSDVSDASHRSQQSAEEEFLQKEDAVTLLRAMTHLSEPQRAVLRHRFYEGLNVRQTAERVDRCVGAVRSQQLRALRKLERVLEDSGLAREAVQS